MLPDYKYAKNISSKSWSISKFNIDKSYEVNVVSLDDILKENRYSYGDVILQIFDRVKV
jgi:hypothetical protein